MGVVPQAVKELRPVGLSVDRLQLVVLDERLAASALGDRVLISALRAAPDPGHARQGSEIRQGIRVAVRLGEDVRAVRVGRGPLRGVNDRATAHEADRTTDLGDPDPTRRARARATLGARRVVPVTPGRVGWWRGGRIASRAEQHAMAVATWEIGGGGGIRTHGTCERSTVFKTVAFDLSATPPGRAASGANDSRPAATG